MQAPVIAAVIAGFVAAVGWIVSYSLTSAATQRSLKQAASLKHVEAQLEQLYGPLAFLVLEGRQTFQELLGSLGRTYVFDAQDRISERDLKTWLFWVDNDFLPRNQKIKELLSQKTHLLDLKDSKMPRSYLTFLDHYNSWIIRHLRWKSEGIPYSWHSKINWPVDFEEDVLGSFQKLQDEHSRMLGRVSETPTPMFSPRTRRGLTAAAGRMKA